MTSPLPSQSANLLRVRGPLELTALAAGALLAGALILGLGTTPRNFADLALGKETTPVYAELDGHPIHCGALPDARRCIAGHAARGRRPALVWLGNSQLHAINQYRAGDQTAPALLHQDLEASGLDVLAFSLPNANSQELLVLFAFLSEELPIRTLVVPLVFDDYRETGLREDVAKILFEEPRARARLEVSPVGRIVAERATREDEGTLAALEGTVQERSEAFLNGWLDEHWRLWSVRPRARGTVFLELRRLRNSAFGITPQSKRRALPARLELNHAAMAQIFEEARERGIETVAYVAPIRDDVPIPYVRSEYDSFKAESEKIAREHGARFVDLEALVPSRYWGKKSGTSLDENPELDFMHFQGPGHRLLATAIRERLEKGPEAASR